MNPPIFHELLFRRLIATKPIKPEPRSQMAPGMGTFDNATLSTLKPLPEFALNSCITNFQFSSDRLKKPNVSTTSKPEASGLLEK